MRQNANNTHSYKFIQLQVCQIINETINLLKPIILKTDVNEVVWNGHLKLISKRQFFSVTPSLSLLYKADAETPV